MPKSVGWCRSFRHCCHHQVWTDQQTEKWLPSRRFDWPSCMTMPWRIKQTRRFTQWSTTWQFVDLPRRSWRQLLVEYPSRCIRGLSGSKNEPSPSYKVTKLRHPVYLGSWQSGSSEARGSEKQIQRVTLGTYIWVSWGLAVIHEADVNSFRDQWTITISELGLVDGGTSTQDCQKDIIPSWVVGIGAALAAQSLLSPTYALVRNAWTISLIRTTYIMFAS